MPQLIHLAELTAELQLSSSSGGLDEAQAHKQPPAKMTRAEGGGGVGGGGREGGGAGNPLGTLLRALEELQALRLAQGQVGGGGSSNHGMDHEGGGEGGSGRGCSSGTSTGVGAGVGAQAAGAGAGAGARGGSGAVNVDNAVNVDMNNRAVPTRTRAGRR